MYRDWHPSIYPSTSSSCPPCQLLEASFFCMVWSCPFLRSYWMEVVADFDQVCQFTLGLDPKVLLLNVFDNSTLGQFVKLFICYTLYTSLSLYHLLYPSGILFTLSYLCISLPTIIEIVLKSLTKYLSVLDRLLGFG